MTIKTSEADGYFHGAPAGKVSLGYVAVCQRCKRATVVTQGDLADRGGRSKQTAEAWLRDHGWVKTTHDGWLHTTCNHILKSHRANAKRLGATLVEGSPEA